MSPFATTIKNDMLDSETIDLLSLHDGIPGEDGSNELSGGDYDREAATVNAASSGARALDADVAIAVPEGASVAYIGFWEAGTPDVFKGWAPNGPTNNPPRGVHADATSNEIQLPGHGYSDDDTVIFLPLGSALPSPLTLGTIYHVINADADSFEVSTTQGGSAVDIAADGDFLVQRIVVESYVLAGQHTVKAGTSVAL